MEKEIKVTKSTVTVTVRVPEWKPGRPKMRVYETTVRDMIKEAHPKVPLGKCMSGSTFRTAGPEREATWVFEVAKPVSSVPEIKEKIAEIKEKIAEAKPRTPPKRAKKRTPKKEVVNDKTDSSD